MLQRELQKAGVVPRYRGIINQIQEREINQGLADCNDCHQNMGEQDCTKITMWEQCSLESIIYDTTQSASLQTPTREKREKGLKIQV